MRILKILQKNSTNGKGHSRHGWVGFLQAVLFWLGPISRSRLALGVIKGGANFFREKWKKQQMYGNFWREFLVS